MSSSLRELENAFSRSPSLESCLDLGRFYLEHDQLMEAMVVCKKGLKLSSNHPQAQALLAEIYLGQGKDAKAFELANSLVNESSCADAASVLGKIAEKKGDSEGAIEAYTRALGLDGGCESAQQAMQRLRPETAKPAQTKPVPEQASLSNVSIPPAPKPPTPLEISHSVTYTRVSDVFSDDNLGFDDSEPYEVTLSTEKRSTILGFVPGQKGSLRNTLVVALALLLGTGTVIYWLWSQAQRAQEIASISQTMLKALEKDTFSDYQEVLVLGNQLGSLESDNPLASAFLVYTHAVLGIEHGVDGAVEQAQKLLSSLPPESHQFSFAKSARVQLDRFDGKNELVWAEWESELKKGGIDPRMVLEAFLAKSKLDPSGSDTVALRARLIESLTIQTRAHHLMGWYFFRIGDWTRALASFEKVLNNSHDHIGGMLGRGFTLMSTKSINAKDDIQSILDEVAKRESQLDSVHLSELYHWLKAEHGRFSSDKDEVLQSQKKRQDLLAQSRSALFAYREGRIQAEANDAGRAVEQFQQAALLEPTSVEYVLSWVQVLMLQKKFEEGLKALKAARQNGLKDPVLELATIEIQIKANKPVEWSRVETVQRTHGPSLFAKAQYLKAMGLRLNSKAVEAGSLLEGYLDGMPTSVIPEQRASLWCELGNTYWETSRKDEAVAAYQLGLDASPRNTECIKQLCARSAGALKDKACRLRQ